MTDRNPDGTFKRGNVANPNGRRGKRTDYDDVPRLDGFQNAALGFGTSADKRLGGSYVVEPLSQSQCQSIWRASDIAARVIETLPREALARSFDLTVKTDGEFDDLKQSAMDLLDEVGALEALEVALRYDRAYGGGALLLGANDGKTMDTPLNVDAVTELAYVTALEPHEIMPVRAYTDREHPKYGRTSHYALVPTVTLTGDPLNRTLPPDAMELHETRLIVFNGQRVSRMVSGTAGAWTGDSVLVRVLRALADFDQAFASTGVILAEHGLPVFSMKELAKLVNANRLDVVKARMALLFQQMSATRAAVMDTEESYQRLGSPLTGLGEILDRVCMRLAASAEMPLTMLMGRSAAGLNATGEGDAETWYRSVEIYQTRRVRPALRRLVEIAMRATGLTPPDSYSITFPPLWVPSAKEESETRSNLANADQVWVEMGALTPEEVRRSRFAGGEFSMETSVSMDDYDDLADLTKGPLTDEDKQAMGMPSPTTPSAPTTGKTAASAPVSNNALNGAQVSALVGICQSYAQGALARESAKEIILAAFPTVTPEQAEAMLPINFKAPPAPAQSNTPTPAKGNAEPPPTPDESKPVEKVGA